MRPKSVLGALALVFLMSISLAAQGRPTGGSGGTRPSTGNTKPSSNPSNFPPMTSTPTINETARPLFLSGRVKVDDGTDLTDAASIESVCNGDRHFEAYTDRKGNFSFQFGKQRQMGNDDVATSSAEPVANPTVRQQRLSMQQCELIAVLPGFTSQNVELASMDTSEVMDVGTIVLHRLAHVEGFTISATSAMAPAKAKKDFAKGREEEQKKKWDAAQKKFEQAVHLYPKYAVAWLELGRMQVQQKDVAGARQSFQQASQADPAFVSPHQELAVLALQARNWQEVVDEAGTVVRLNPVSFPQDWYYNSVGNYYLGHYDAAEHSARKGIGADVEHRIPRLEYVLGVILAQKHDLAGAAAHMRNYVRMAPQAPDVNQVNNQIAQIEKAAPQPATQTK